VLRLFSVLIIVPTGLHPSGVITWAVRLASALAERGREAGLLLHGRAVGPLAEELSPAVRVFEHPELPHFDDLSGDLSGVVPVYAGAVEAMSGRGHPVVVSPNLHGDCYGSVAALTQVMPGRLRAVGWAHSDNRYDARVLSHYEPILHGLVGVSGVLSGILAEAIPTRSVDIHRIPYGVRVDDRVPRDPLGADRPLRLVYTGRVEEEQKRASALLWMSRSLAARGVAHELRIVGDGVSRAGLENESAGDGSVRWLGSLSPSGVRDVLRWADAFVLPSRYEGLSVSMLEAMACGCVPVVSRVRSGAAEAIVHGESGLLVGVGENDSARATGEAFGAVLAGVDRARMDEVAGQAARRAADLYGIDRHAETVDALLERMVTLPARVWPATHPIAFRGTPTGGGTTPSDAPGRFRGAFGALGGKRIAIHGVGRHTRASASVFAALDNPEIVAFCDDDPAKWGSRIWNWPVIDPAAAGAHGIEAVVISSHLHEAAIWERRSVYSRQGIDVVRLYG
jgi:glycosyltransferase involved in cell wall biosynthesis